MDQSIFAQEWRDCLREQFKYVVRENDQRTLNTLKGVMYEVGFTEDNLKQMYVEATMRADDMPDNFVPDVEAVIQPEAPQTAAPMPEPAHESPAEPQEEHQHDEPRKRDDDSGVTQLSLF